MKVMKYLAVASLVSLAACNNEDGPAVSDKGNQPVDVVVSLALPGATTRAAMSELQNTTQGNAAATVENVHVYLLDSKDVIQVAEEFAKGSAEFNKLTSSTVVAEEGNSGGYKFKNVDKSVVKAFVIANPQGKIAVEKEPISTVSQQLLKSQIGDVIYAGTEALTTVGVEPYGGDPTDSKSVVKKAELTLSAKMNRFQVTGTKFVKVVWQDGKYDEAKKWCHDWLTKNVGKTANEAWDAFKADPTCFNSQVWDGKSDITTLTDLSKWLKVVDVTKANRGILMNRFSSTLSVPEFKVEKSDSWLWAKTFVGGRYDLVTGEFKPDGATDWSSVASYYAANGFDFQSASKAAAFNFFVDQISDYGKDGDAPKLVFAFDTDQTTGVTEDSRFVVVSGYAKTEGDKVGTDAITPGNDGGYLINLDLSKLNNNQGILVCVDSTIPSGVLPAPNGQEDLEDENVNVIVRVEVKPWVAVNVYPIIN